jgi:hypothetical protein
MVRPRVRIRFSKQLAPSLFGHRDLMQLHCASAWPVRRANRPAPVSAHAGLLALALRDDIVKTRLAADPGRSAGARDAPAALQLGGLERQGSVLIRTHVETAV